MHFGESCDFGDLAWMLVIRVIWHEFGDSGVFGDLSWIVVILLIWYGLL